MDTLKALGTRIRSLRRERDITQSVLAEKCGLSNNFIALLERGRGAPSIETLEKLARALGVSIADLFEFAEPRGKQDEREKVIRRLLRVRSARDLRLIGEIAEFLGRN